MRFIFCGWKKTTLPSVTKSPLHVPSRIAPSFTINIATLTTRVLDVSDFAGAWRTGGVGACEWDGSWFSIPLQLLLGEHLRLPVRIHQGTDLRWHLKGFRWKPWKKRCDSHLFLHKGAHLKRNLEAFFLWFKIGNLESWIESAIKSVLTSLATSIQSS